MGTDLEIMQVKDLLEWWTRIEQVLSPFILIRDGDLDFLDGSHVYCPETKELNHTA